MDNRRKLGTQRPETQKNDNTKENVSPTFL